MPRLRLKYWRKVRAFNIRQLSEEAHVSPRVIIDIERGHFPRASVIRKLANTLNITVEQLVQLEDDKEHQLVS